MLDGIKIIPRETIAAFCQKWSVAEFALFGSILREDFSADSDVDVLVTFTSDSRVSLLDLAQMQLELEEIFDRAVDLVEKESITNPYRKTSILKNAEVIFAA